MGEIIAFPMRAGRPSPRRFRPAVALALLVTATLGAAALAGQDLMRGSRAAAAPAGDGTRAFAGAPQPSR